MYNLSQFESNSQSSTTSNNLSYNFNNTIKQNLTTLYSFTETKSYIPLAGCVLQHILTTTNLTNTEKLYYLLADSLSIIGKNRRITRACALASADWAKYLRCSRSLIFTMQKSLEQKGYFIINKDVDNIGRNKRNLITPTLPLAVFNHLNEQCPNRLGHNHSPYNPLTESKRSYLDKSKLFIKLNYHLLKMIAASNYLNAKQKVLWLSFYTRCYKEHMLKAQKDSSPNKYGNDSSSFAFISSYKEIALENSYNIKDLSKSLKRLEEKGFLKALNIYVRKKNWDSKSCTLQERQDESLWKITLALPTDYILELDKLKDRSNLISKDINMTASNKVVTDNMIVDCLILGKTKFYLNPEQSEFLKSLIDGNSDVHDISTPILPLFHTLSNKTCIDSTKEEVIELTSDIKDSKTEKFNMLCKTKGNKIYSDTKNISFTYDPLKDFKKEGQSNEIKFDPTFAKSRLLLNKNYKIEIFKSNLRALPKVLFNDFLKKRKKTNNNLDEKSPLKKKQKQFNISSELMSNKLKELTQEKADKARKYAYSIFYKKLAKGYASSLNKEELAKQLIYHAATWKPTKLGIISREKEIDTALAVAWKSIVSGTWQPPLEFAKAEVLQYEYQYYRNKYQESGILSEEIKSLEIEVNKLLGRWYDLAKEIKLYTTSKFNKITELNNPDYQCYGSVLPNNSGQNNKYIIVKNKKYVVNIVNNIALYNLQQKSEREHEIRNQLFQNGQVLNYKHKKIPHYNYFYYSFEKVLSTNEVTSNKIVDKVDLSNLLDKQKHLSLYVPNVDNKRYFPKLKTIKVNENGELTISFIRNIKKAFITIRAILNLSSDNQISDAFVKKDYLISYQFSTTKSSKNDIEYTQDRLKGFCKLDGALNRVIEKLIFITNNPR